MGMLVTLSCVVAGLMIAAVSGGLAATRQAFADAGLGWTVGKAEASLPLSSEGTQVEADAQGILILVNWDHPVPYDRPDNLVELTQVFGDEVTLVNAEGEINAEAGAAAAEMFKAARADGIGRYKLASAYRSIQYQEQLWEARLAQDPDYGKDPYTDPVKVVPGRCSEHTTGLAMDVLAESYGTSDDGYAETQEGRWLKENAYKYGFILRYPKDKEHITGVIFEPWHYRYVGKAAAAEIHASGVCLEEYLGAAA
jgi:D-alanyl-D-alanine carboxypeptidase